VQFNVDVVDFYNKVFSKLQTIISMQDIEPETAVVLVQVQVICHVSLCCWAGVFIFEGQQSKKKCLEHSSKDTVSHSRRFFSNIGVKNSSCKCKANVSHCEPCNNCVTFFFLELGCPVFHQILFDRQF
jgi:hypothetical protein